MCAWRCSPADVSSWRPTVLDMSGGFHPTGHGRSPGIVGAALENVGVQDSRLTLVDRGFADSVAQLRAVSDSAGDEELLQVMTLCERVTRELEQVSLAAIGRLEGRGVFASRGYARPAAAVADLLGLDLAVARRRMRVVEQIGERTTPTGGVLPPRLPATAAVFATGEISARHVEVIAEALATREAGRLTPQVWAAAEEKLAEQAPCYRPSELTGFARDLITALDQDGPEPSENDPPQPNELFLTRIPATGGGRIRGSLDAPTFDAIATALDALCAPSAQPTGETTSLGQRQAEALGQLARYSLDHAATPECGGQRPHLTVTVTLDQLEDRARGALLDFGGPLSPTDLRLLACDARVVPVVLGGDGQPLDVGRAQRTVPAPLRRAVAARDRGCAFPGCDRLPSWCEVHHIIPWAHHGETAIHNLVMLCLVHHRLVHHPGWTVRIRDGHPEFIPPGWVDIHRTPRRKPLLV